MPEGDEWLYVCSGENEMILWSIGDIFWRFHVFSVPVPMAKMDDPLQAHTSTSRRLGG